MKSSCWWDHDWSKWEVIEQGRLIRTYLDGKKGDVGSYIVQKRTCKKCGKKDLETQKTRV